MNSASLISAFLLSLLSLFCFVVGTFNFIFVSLLPILMTCNTSGESDLDWWIHDLRFALIWNSQLTWSWITRINQSNVQLLSSPPPTDGLSTALSCHCRPVVSHALTGVSGFCLCVYMHLEHQLTRHAFARKNSYSWGQARALKGRFRDWSKVGYGSLPPLKLFVKTGQRWL